VQRDELAHALRRDGLRLDAQVRHVHTRPCHRTRARCWLLLNLRTRVEIRSEIRSDRRGSQEPLKTIHQCPVHPIPAKTPSSAPACLHSCSAHPASCSAHLGRPPTAEQLDERLGDFRV
jgi:hypothetical protein